MNLKSLLIFTIITTIAVSFTGCKKKETANNDVIKNVKTAEVSRSTITIENQYAGEIKASDEVGVIPKASGKVSEVFVEVGDKVNKGDVLMELDSKDIVFQLEQAKAGVQAAEVNLKKAKGSGYTQSLIQAEAELEQARIAQNDASLNFERIKVLYEQGAVSKREFESAESGMLKAMEQYESAKKNLELLKKGLGPDSVEGAQAQLNQALASLRVIQNQLNNTMITAPISGVVSRRNANVGEGVSPASPAVFISNTDQLIAEVGIPETLINRLKKGQNMSVSVEALGNRILRGIVDNISPVVDQKTRNYTVKVKILESTNEVKPGMFAKIKLELEKKVDVIAVPNQGLISENDLQFVYVVEEGNVKKKYVEIGLSNETVTEIIKGLNINEILIIEGQSFLSEGEKVNSVK